MNHLKPWASRWGWLTLGIVLGSWAGYFWAQTGVV